MVGAPPTRGHGESPRAHSGHARRPIERSTLWLADAGRRGNRRADPRALLPLLPAGRIERTELRPIHGSFSAASGRAAPALRRVGPANRAGPRSVSIRLGSQDLLPGFRKLAAVEVAAPCRQQAAVRATPRVVRT